MQVGSPGGDEEEAEEDTEDDQLQFVENLNRQYADAM